MVTYKLYFLIKFGRQSHHPQKTQVIRWSIGDCYMDSCLSPLERFYVHVSVMGLVFARQCFCGTVCGSCSWSGGKNFGDLECCFWHWIFCFFFLMCDLFCIHVYLLFFLWLIRCCTLCFSTLQCLVSIKIIVHKKRRQLSLPNLFFEGQGRVGPRLAQPSPLRFFPRSPWSHR